MLMLRGANGLAIAADRWGEPGNPLVLLQHGGGQTRHAWKGTGEALARCVGRERTWGLGMGCRCRL
jgi:pimeloyl-ACP methyl ester carboxylesterase